MSHAPDRLVWMATVLLLAASTSAQVVEEMVPVPGPLSGRVAYARLTDGVWQIWEADLRTGKTCQVTNGRPDKRLPAWRSDGSLSWHDVNQGATAASSDRTKCEPVLEKLWPVRDLAWSRDGMHVMFTRIRTDLVDAMNIWIAGPEGQDARTVTSEPGVQCHAAWSPDGTRIAYSSGQGWGTYEIWTVGADGKDRRQLTKDRTHDFYPAWSPDQKRIAWSSDRSGDYEIWVMDADGSSPVQLTRALGVDTRPTWSPDGSHLAFASSRGGRMRIFVIDVGGAAERPLDFLGDNVADPAWAPALPADTAADAAPPSRRSPLLSRIGVEPKVLDPATSGEVTFRYELSGAARVVVDVVDRYGVLVRRLDAGDRDQGPQSVSWDGTAFDGGWAPAGVYRYVIHAEGRDRSVEVYDPSLTTGGEELKPREFQVDPEKGRIRFVMPRAGYARLRVALQNFPYLGSLLDWEPLPAGPFEMPWDGKDPSGAVRLAGHEDLSVVLWLYALPDNAIIVRGEDRERRMAGTPLYPPLIHGENAFFHARHDPARCGPIRQTLEFPDHPVRDAEGRRVLSGKVPVRVRLDPRDRDRVLAARYEIAVYVDLVFLFEEEDGIDPFTFTWDTTSLPPGEHLLTVDVLAYDDHYGVVTERVVIRPEPGEPR